MKFTLEQLNSLKGELYVLRRRLDEIPKGTDVLECKNSKGETLAESFTESFKKNAGEYFASKFEDALKNDEKAKTYFADIAGILSEKFYTGIVVKVDGKYYDCSNKGAKYEQEPIDESTIVKIATLTECGIDLNKLRFLPVDEERCAVDIDDDCFDEVNNIISKFGADSEDTYINGK